MLEEGPLNKSEISFNHYLIHKYIYKKTQVTGALGNLISYNQCPRIKNSCVCAQDGVLFLIPGLA